MEKTAHFMTNLGLNYGFGTHKFQLNITPANEGGNLYSN